MRRSICTALAVILAGALVIPALAGDEKKPGGMDAATQQAMMKLMMPGPQHEAMAKMAGNWDYTIKWWMDPNSPPAESQGKRTAEMLLGGRYLQEKFSGPFMGQTFEGIGTLAYDNVTKEWVSTWIDNMGTGIMVEKGQRDDKGAWTLSGETMDPMTGQPVKTKSVVSMPDENTIDMAMYTPGPDGKDVKMMEMTMKRSM